MTTRSSHRFRIPKTENIAMNYEIRRARGSDLIHLADIELAAARMLEGHAPDAVLRETTPLHDLDAARLDGLLWVAATAQAPVGFAHVKLIEPRSAHLDELDVHPAYGRRGLGRRLVMSVCEWAATAGLAAVTLSTFRHLPWNEPFYASLGFDVVPPAKWSEAIARVVADETGRGLDPDRRVIMCRRAS
jgi:GNAT superfamily N-acetyltransferase